MKNQTGLKSLDLVESMPAVTLAYRDSDGIWIEVAPGWTCNPGDAHTGHEDTAKAALRVIRGIEPCTCQDCQKAHPCHSPTCEAMHAESAAVSSAAAILGRKGGKVGGLTKGASKRRGDAEYYRALQAKGAAARKGAK